ncbi:uncharacterized protein LOC115229017 isoform X2 [Octopus sinensis]|uniref:Uncharacterized protein LOC115229017 isoform X2 n=1 Tax=Octopus sinensis TaxID=2607531 RepID=A0A7E6EJB4_9MOLL|nr:uncharacterized protein LOC115229017 isoform X2 [Octopus sinensis]
MGRLMFSCLMIVFCFYFTRAGIYKIIQSENVVLGGSARLSIYIPNMKRPTVWKCGNYKYECDRTCANGPEYTVTHSGNHSVLWIRKVTKECLTWMFEDDNINVGKIHLKINNLANANDLRTEGVYNITQSENVVLGRSAKLSIYIPNMKRPVVWKCGNYKYECDRTCANGHDYKVTHNGNHSVLWIRKVTKKCLTWMFVDDNINVGKIHLKINNEETKDCEADGSGIPTSTIVVIFVLCLENIILIILWFKFKLPPYDWCRNRVTRRIPRNEPQNQQVEMRVPEAADQQTDQEAADQQMDQEADQQWIRNQQSSKWIRKQQISKWIRNQQSS